MAALICGSLAYDSLSLFEGRFRDHILPDQMHILNVSFLVPTMRREFGGCAGNIAYGLNLLGGDARIMATVGETDAKAYLDHLDSLGLRRDHVRVIPGQNTAQASVMSDLENNQITSFHPGAMMFSHQNRIADVAREDIRIAIVAPDGPDGMRSHCAGLAEAGIPFIFDPGQGLPLFDGATLRTMIEQSTYLTVNDYESKLLADKTGLSEREIAERVQALVVTRGAEGSQIHHRGEVIDIPAVKPAGVVDPTGCGDAFRGGLLYGIEQGFDWPTSGRLASLMGALKIAQKGPQTYHATPAEVAEAFEQAFGYRY
ncbi:carbohydrate kinase family protein [Chitinasiproducens palmae]|uniref:Adenosine kinase n=1 Tax=Chitinasiproducens palmae TaxID=1770053 RepID=A0A1H2PRQ3_9BURK|nr:carbohydrate kinase family protein [Chitinasiproducens palmae]SDV49550.1 adenosine kinase [Chitinasiproducens palmae]